MSAGNPVPAASLLCRGGRHKPGRAVALAVALALLTASAPLGAQEPATPPTGGHDAPRRHVLQGALIGAAFGALLGFGLHHCPPANDPATGPCPRFTESIGDSALAFGAVGAGVGFLIRTGPRATGRPAVSAVGIAPRRGGVAIAASLRF